MKVIVSGSIGRYPVGGHAWIDMQYMLALRALGHDVYYLEECGHESWVYDWDRQELTTDLGYPARYLGDCLETIGFGDRWIYRAGADARGMDVTEFVTVCDEADLLLIRAVPLELWRPEYMRVRRRAFIDADPGFTQIGWLRGEARLGQTIDRSEQLFTVGQRVGKADCRVPTGDRHWHTTLPPVFLAEWTAAPSPDPQAPFTCVMHWRGHRDVQYDGVLYGQKDLEFPRFAELPGKVERSFVLAVTGDVPGHLADKGWHIEPGWVTSRTPKSYRDFLRSSFAEFGVAKHGYVAMRGGWFSDRTACYLATGRPAVIEDTGLADWLPIGEGIRTFSDLQGAVDAVRAIEPEYERHCRAARAIAEQFFDGRLVVGRLMEEACA